MLPQCSTLTVLAGCSAHGRCNTSDIFTLLVYYYYYYYYYYIHLTSFFPGQLGHSLQIFGQF